jgi:hypothetical protein
MAGKAPVAASDEQKAALRALAGSRDRGEADRARAVLLTLSGWTSPRIAEAFGVREDTVRLWRSDFARGGVAALKTSPAPGPAPVKAEAALRVVRMAALAVRAHWLTVEWLPKYAPELNDIEVVWHDLKAHHLAHQTFTDAEALDRAVHHAVAALNLERNIDPLVKQRISA